VFSDVIFPANYLTQNVPVKWCYRLLFEVLSSNGERGGRLSPWIADF
jgi:hypothetical protein